MTLRTEEAGRKTLVAEKLQAVGQLAGGVAHDFNNSLGVVQGYSEFILERISKDDPLRRSVEEIAKHRSRDEPDQATPSFGKNRSFSRAPSIL